MTSTAAEVATLDATAQAALVRRGEVSAAELVEGAIERVEALNALWELATALARELQNSSPLPRSNIVPTVGHY